MGGALGDKIPNVAQYDVKQAEIAFLAGAAAAMLSKQVRSATSAASKSRRSSTPARNSAMAPIFKPDIKLFEAYAGDFDNVSKSKEATLAAISQGAICAYHILNLGLRGMEQAARERARI